ncbi:MAG: hypothetical protein ACRYFW_05290, partial [Janthinobacterium lividum]
MATSVASFPTDAPPRRQHPDLVPLRVSSPSFEAVPPPGARVKMGSDEHRRLMARMMLDTHDPYRPALI